LSCVFDSGVWISAFQFGGTPLTALRFAYMPFRLAACNPIFHEIHKTLAGKFGWTSLRIETAVADYLDNTVLVEFSGKMSGICRDPKDDMLLECAVLAGADIVVTGDKDLFTLNSFQGVRILTQRAFLNLKPL